MSFLEWLAVIQGTAVLVGASAIIIWIIVTIDYDAESDKREGHVFPRREWWYGDKEE